MILIQIINPYNHTKKNALKYYN